MAAVASLVLPGVAVGAEATADPGNAAEASINAMWVIVAGVLVMFMQAGFLLLEVGFSRAKNAGAGVAKILVNFSIASLCYWAVGFALAFGGLGEIAGTTGSSSTSARRSRRPAKSIPFVETYSISPAAFMFFQFVFCAVSLAIVWGTTLERIKFGAYVIYAIVFSAVIYPIISHWVFGGGWLQVNVGDAGLRRLDGRPPDRRDRRAGGAAAARPADRASTTQTASRGRSPGTRCRWSASAC